MMGTTIEAIGVTGVYLQAADNSIGPKIGDGGKDDHVKSSHIGCPILLGSSKPSGKRVKRAAWSRNICL
jgi:hypothetical protein